MKKFCKQCGERLSKESQFCTECGTQLSSNTTIKETTKNISQTRTKDIGIKLKIGLTLTVVILLASSFWFMNRNPLQGVWSKDIWNSSIKADAHISLNITNQETEITFFMKNDTEAVEVIITGPFIKQENHYLLPIIDTNITVKASNVFEDRDEFEEELSVMKDELLNSGDLTSNQQRVIEKIINSIELSGRDVSGSFSVKEVMSIYETPEFSDAKIAGQNISVLGQSVLSFDINEHNQVEFQVPALFHMQMLFENNVIVLEKSK